MEEEHRHWATTAYLTQPISAYESLSNKDSSDSLAIPWPADVVAYYQQTFFGEHSTLNRAHQVIPVSSVASVVQKVRNKLLEFALELQGEVGNAEPTPANISPAKVEGMVTNIILGGQTNVFGGAVHGDIIQGVNQTVVKGDFASLSKALEGIGVPTSELPELQAALNEDAKQQDVTSIGAKATEWIAKAAKGGLKVAGKVAEQVMVAAVRAYLGI
jgi:hypothetical protein